MPTPQAYDRLWKEHQLLRATALRLLWTDAIDQKSSAFHALWYLVGDMGPHEADAILAESGIGVQDAAVPPAAEKGEG